MKNKLLILISLLAAVAVVSWCVKKQSQKPVVNNNQQMNTNTPIQNGDEEIDTSDWLTYINTRYGYKMSYPTNWEIKLYDDYDPKFYGTVLLTNSLDTNQEIFIITEERNPNRLSIVEWAKEGDWPGDNTFDEMFTQIKLNNKIEALEQFPTGTIFLAKDKNIIDINNGVGMVRGVVEDSLFKQIVSTFEFID